MSPLTREYSQFCTASILGMVCELAAGHDTDRPTSLEAAVGGPEHHYVAGVCPVHGQPARRTRNPRTDFPHCGSCGRALIPSTKVVRS